MAYCDICGKRQATDVHHLLSGTDRKKCDEYPFMKLNLCRICHDDIHKFNTATMLSKMLGQALYETRFSRTDYMRDFRKNYLP